MTPAWLLPEYVEDILPHYARAAELLRPIPYVPVTTDHMALYSREAFNLVRTGSLQPLVCDPRLRV